jgi:hypothetical protein
VSRLALLSLGFHITSAWLLADATVHGGRCVEFDVVEVAACRDVTSTEFAAANPDEKLVEARIRVSSLVHPGREDDLLQLLYVLESPRRTLRVHDYWPKTQLESELAGNVSVESTRGRSSSLGLNVDASYGHLLAADAAASRGDTVSRAVRYELLPPLSVLAASGTTGRSTGAYFKLKPSPRTALEGDREFMVVVRVPADWRGDVLRLRVEALAEPRGLSRSLHSYAVCSVAHFTIGLYVQGDQPAKHLACQLVRQERRLRRLARTRREAIQQSQAPSLIHRIGQALSVVEPRVPSGWLETVVHGPPEQLLPFSRYLPADVRAAVADYVATRRQLDELACSTKT